MSETVPSFIPASSATGGTPNARFFSDNDLGIPTLDLRLQADYVDEPFEIWGAKGRSLPHRGTVAFYADDYRFATIWKDPSKLVKTGCVSAVEVNYTASLGTPLAFYQWLVYQRRWMAAYWQSMGVRIFVDMNNPVEFIETTLTGVPLGWRAYATHGYQNRIEGTLNEYHEACRHAQSEDILFVVYGGGRLVKEMCRKHRFIFVAEENDRKRGRLNAMPYPTEVLIETNSVHVSEGT